jgi:CRISPR-associated endoribonuclease Cas6
MFKELTFAKFTFILKVETQMSLPAYKGGTFRGGLGYSLKRVVCIHKKQSCDGCMLRKQCVYGYIFDTIQPENSEILKNRYEIPRPFIIETIYEEKTHYNPEEEISFNLILVGKAIELLPYFIISFDDLGKVGLGINKGKFSIEKIESEGQVIYDPESQSLIGSPRIIQISDLVSSVNINTHQIDINILTPIRIKYQGRLIDNPEFHILIRNILRRAFCLSYFHCGGSMDPDTVDMSSAEEVTIEHNNSRWYDWQRYSTRQDTDMKLGGIIGEVTYTGELEQFIPLLLLGEYIHVGKNTSFGLGKYIIS